jgi:hypothetical protein
LYIICYEKQVTCVRALQSLLELGMKSKSDDGREHVLSDSPLDIHVMLSHLSFEASRVHVLEFLDHLQSTVSRNDYDYETLAYETLQMLEVHLHLTIFQDRPLSDLGTLSMYLKNASELAYEAMESTQVALVAANGIRDMAETLESSAHPTSREATLDKISYVIQSLESRQILYEKATEKKLWAMSLLAHLTTQKDAANNMALAASMKIDSRSMKAIAALTMVFLPGTFVAVLRANPIFWTETDGLTDIYGIGDFFNGDRRRVVCGNRTMATLCCGYCTSYRGYSVMLVLV